MTNIISQGHTSNILVRSKFRFKLLTHEGHLCGKVITSGTDCGIVCTRDEIKKNVENAIFFTEICRPYFCRIAFSLSRVVERKDSASFFFWWISFSEPSTTIDSFWWQRLCFAFLGHIIKIKKKGQNPSWFCGLYCSFWLQTQLVKVSRWSEPSVVTKASGRSEHNSETVYCNTEYWDSPLVHVS